MSEAENKWREWDRNKNDSEDYPLSCSLNSREAYKAALRREIEKEKQVLWAPHYSSYDLKAIQTLDKVLKLLDTVEPVVEPKP